MDPCLVKHGFQNRDIVNVKSSLLTQYTIFALQPNANAFRQVFRYEGRHSDTQIDVVTVSKFPGSSTTDPVPLDKCILLCVRTRCWGRRGGVWIGGEGRKFNLLGGRGTYDAIDIYTRKMNLVRIESAARYDFFGLWMVLG